jgi:hypothetical protein
MIRGVSDIFVKCPQEFSVKGLPEQCFDGITQAEDEGPPLRMSDARDVGEVRSLLNGEVSAYLIPPQIDRVLDAIQRLDLGQVHPFFQGIGVDGAEPHPIPHVGEKAHLVRIGKAAWSVSVRKVKAHRLPFQAVDLATLRALGRTIGGQGGLTLQGLSSVGGEEGENPGQVRLEALDLGLAQDTAPVAALGLAAVEGRIAGVGRGEDPLVHPDPVDEDGMLLLTYPAVLGHHRPQSRG